ncbi:MAG: S-layer homology domain-containing protein [Cohnella sp.]|nr:S-layer homology domain-containing protein [Cohnella sp.]
MPQQRPFSSANEKYRKKLFVDTGMTFAEVEARIVEPYNPPAPNLRVKELRIINAPSHFQQMGIASYATSFTLLFNNKEAYADYLVYCGWTHKFYDERGAMYLGAAASINPKAVEAGKRYLVEVSLVLIKKDSYDEPNKFEFQDLVDDNTGEPHWAKDDIEQMANLGLVSVLERSGEPILYFRPDAYSTRAEFVTFLTRTKRLIERVVRE